MGEVVASEDNTRRTFLPTFATKASSTDRDKRRWKIFVTLFDAIVWFFSDNTLDPSGFDLGVWD